MRSLFSYSVMALVGCTDLTVVPCSPVCPSLPCPRMCIPKVSGDEGKLCSRRYLTIARAGQKGVREGFLEEMVGSDFHRTEKDRCSWWRKLCELIEQPVFLLCLILLEEKHTSSLQNKSTFTGSLRFSLRESGAHTKALDQSELLFCISCEGGNEDQKTGLCATFLKSGKSQASKS